MGFPTLFYNVKVCCSIKIVDKHIESYIKTKLIRLLNYEWNTNPGRHGMLPTKIWIKERPSLFERQKDVRISLKRPTIKVSDE